MRKNNDSVKFPKLADMPRAWHRISLGLTGDDESPTSSSKDPHGPHCTHPEGEHDSNCCRRHAVVLPGYGKDKYPFPTTDELVRMSIEYINALARAYKKQGKKLTLGQDNSGAGDVSTDETALVAFIAAGGVRTTVRPRLHPGEIARGHSRRQSVLKSDSLDEEGGTPARVLKSGIGSLPKPSLKTLIPQTDGKVTETTGPVLRVVAGTLAEIMHAGRFKAVIARQFDPLKGAVNWAINHMSAKFQPAAHSLKEHLDKLEEIYAEALPRVIMFLGSQYPKASEEELLNAAVSVLNEQLAEILYVLSIWTDSFAQQRDGMYRQLLYVVFTVEQAFFLFRTGDAKGGCDTKCQEAIKTHAFHIGDVFMARFSDQGPATIPGGRGPVGAHAIEVPHDESDVIVIYLPLYLHEFRHDYYNDVEGLADNETQQVVQAILEAYEAGQFQFTSEFIKIGNQKVRTIDMITQVYAQTLSETDADIAGGVMLSGSAFLYSMIATFSAFNMRGVSAFNVNQMLRHKSYFAVGEQGELAFEPHMPDYMRAYVVAAALELIGFQSEADECRKLADQAAGVPLPESIVWVNVDPKSKFKFKIQVPCADLKQVAPVVVNAIINAPLAALGGVCTSQLVNWNRKRQDKVDALAKNLMAGKSDLPTDIGDVWAPYVAAAAITAVWGLVKSGAQPMYAAAMVETNARIMMDAVRERFHATPPVVDKNPVVPVVQPLGSGSPNDTSPGTTGDGVKGIAPVAGEQK